MDKAEIFAHIDHTLLKADATISEIEHICVEAVSYTHLSVSICLKPAK